MSTITKFVLNYPRSLYIKTTDAVEVTSNSFVLFIKVFLIKAMYMNGFKIFSKYRNTLKFLLNIIAHLNSSMYTYSFEVVYMCQKIYQAGILQI